MDGICTFCENILPREYGRSDPTEKYDDQKSGIVELLFPIIYSGAIGIYVLVLVFGIGMTLAGSAVNQKCDRGGDERTCVFFFYVFS